MPEPMTPMINAMSSDSESRYSPSVTRTSWAKPNSNTSEPTTWTAASTQAHKFLYLMPKYKMAAAMSTLTAMQT